MHSSIRVFGLCIPMHEVSAGTIICMGYEREFKKGERVYACACVKGVFASRMDARRENYFLHFRMHFICLS